MKASQPHDKILIDWGVNVCRSDDDEPVRPGIKQRLFCDICDMFDQHDTDDCPTQSSGAPDDQGTQYHGNRNEERAYCDICEGMEILDYMLSSIGLIVVELWFVTPFAWLKYFLFP